MFRSIVSRSLFGFIPVAVARSDRNDFTMTLQKKSSPGLLFVADDAGNALNWMEYAAKLLRSFRTYNTIQTGTIESLSDVSREGKIIVVPLEQSKNMTEAVISCVSDGALEHNDHYLKRQLNDLQIMRKTIENDLDVQTKCYDIASQLLTQESLFVLGKGYGESVAKEAAVWFSKTGKIHAEGYSGGALKHGPFALISRNTPVLLILLDDEHCRKMQTAAQEIKARGAHLIIVTDKPELGQGLTEHKNIILIPHAGPLTALLALEPIDQICKNISK